MDYLFTELMLWARSQGYVWFSLGMAPLAGLEEHRLAPAWHKLGRLVYRYGENFYNFEGLRDNDDAMSSLGDGLAYGHGRVAVRMDSG